MISRASSLRFSSYVLSILYNCLIASDVTRCNYEIFHLKKKSNVTVFSERELGYRPSVCRSSVVCRSVTFVRPTQAIEMFGNVSTPFGTLAIC